MHSISSILAFAEDGSFLDSLLVGIEVLVWLAATIVFAWIVYQTFLDAGSVQRRQERALGFLQLLATGINQGRSPENTICSLSESREQSFGIHFHLLAAYIAERGCR